MLVLGALSSEDVSASENRCWPEERLRCLCTEAEMMSLLCREHDEAADEREATGLL